MVSVPKAEGGCRANNPRQISSRPLYAPERRKSLFTTIFCFLRSSWLLSEFCESRGTPGHLRSSPIHTEFKDDRKDEEEEENWTKRNLPALRFLYLKIRIYPFSSFSPSTTDRSFSQPFDRYRRPVARFAVLRSGDDSILYSAE